MDYWILLDGENIINKTERIGGIVTNNLPLTLEEVKKVKKSKYTNAKCINISKDIRDNGITLENNQYLEERQNIFYTWYNKFLNKNINGFSMPDDASSNSEYIRKLNEILENYKKEINKIAFKYEENLVDDVNKNCDKVLEVLNTYLKGDKEKAKLIITLLIKKYINEPFWVSDLDKSYAFRGIAPFVNLHSSGYEGNYKNMMNGDIDFYRGRSGSINKERKEMLHIPYSLLNLVNEQRFSLEGQPCLYLGTTSYVCWKELREPNLDKFCLSGFRANELGKTLKIFNLVASETLINGIYQNGEDSIVRKNLQNSMIKLMPIIFATSFSVSDESRSEKYEYIISQLIMQSLSELEIDGVAYLSKRGNDDFQYPQGVNLAIPILDISNKKQYGKVCDKFIITEPSVFAELVENTIDNQEKSYINKAFKNYFGTKNYNSDFSQYSKVDNIISSKEYKCYK